MAKHRESKVGVRGRVCYLTPLSKFTKTGPFCHSDKNVGILIQSVLHCGLYKSYGQQGAFKVAPFHGLIFIYQTDPVGYASKRVFLKFIDFELYELYYASCETLDRLRVHLNMYLVLYNPYLLPCHRNAKI